MLANLPRLLEEKLTPREARRQRLLFARKAKAIRRKNDKLFKSASGEAARYVRELRAEVRNLLVLAPGFELRHLSGIRADLDAAVLRWRERFDASLAVRQDETWALGASLAEEGFKAAGVEVALPMLPETLLVATKDYTAGLVTNVARETTEKISANIRRSIIAGESVHKSAKRIEDVLFKAKKGTFWRAEKIVRTETGRVFSMANQERMKQAKEQVPDIRKQWMTAEDERVRETHAAAGRKYAPGGSPGPIPITEPFQVGAARLMYPSDPAGPPSETVNCRCNSLPWREAWKA